jgi:heme A synthase
VVAVQVALGALTVVAGNGAPTVAAHLLTGLALLGGATVTAVCAVVPLRACRGRRLGRVPWVAVCAAGVLFVSGSLVVNADAEKACASVPLCPPDQPGALVALHLGHRAVAVLAGTALLAFAVHAWRHWSELPAARALAVALAALVWATAGLGVVTALLKAPPGWQDLHLAGAAAVLVVSVGLTALGWLGAADSSSGDGGAGRPTPAPPTQAVRARP